MNQSEQIDELAAALTAAQASLKPALKDSRNPRFGPYADLSSVWDACREVLPQNGLAVAQTFVANELTAAGWLTLRTTLMHKSGQWIAGEMTIPAHMAGKEGAVVSAQSFGASATYARRFGLAAIVGITAEDNDGEGGAAIPAGGAQTGSYPAQERPQASAGQSAGPAAPSAGVWTGPGQCPTCHAPTGKTHGKPCVG